MTLHGGVLWYDICMFSLALKTKARKLRSQGKTYLEIRKFLDRDIPKSTLSGWCSNIELPKNYTRKIKTLNKLRLGNARRKAIELKKEKRVVFFRELSLKNQSLVKFFKKSRDAHKIVLLFYT